MKKIVNSCINCPFFYTMSDNITSLNICNLSKFLNLEVFTIDSDNTVPEWCPIKKEKIEISFYENVILDTENNINDIEIKSDNEYVDDINEQINKVQEQISLLEDASDRLKKLFENLENLDSNDINNLNNIIKDL